MKKGQCIDTSKLDKLALKSNANVNVCKTYFTYKILLILPVIILKIYL